MTEFTSEFIAEQKKIFDNPELDISIWVAEACGNYYLALDYIEHLQARVNELEVYENKNQSTKEVARYWVQKLREEEARADLHANLNRKIANALGKKINENWSDMPEIVVQLKQRIEELEAERRWIPVSEAKPELDKNSNEDGTINVLVYIKNYKRILEATYYPKMAVWNMPYGWGDETDNITHWMIAIPQPPKDGE